MGENRFGALVGDAELNEDNVWEAVLDAALEGLDNLLWMVDLNRQRLDRVIPGIRAARLKRLCEAMGWRAFVVDQPRNVAYRKAARSGAPSTGYRPGE